MQRLFTVFPAGVPGLSLLLLRLGVAATLWQSTAESDLVPSGLLFFALCLNSVLLVLGLATPLAGTATFIALMKWFDPLNLHTLACTSMITAGIESIFALSLILIGPGAFSIDARLFGRRIITTS